MIEEWRIISEFPSFEVSNFGRVRKIKTGKLRALYLSNGYHRIFFKKGFTRSIHWLVTLAFFGPTSKKYVLHKDGNVLNNHLSNLEYSDTLPIIEGRNRKLADIGKNNGKQQRETHLKRYTINHDTQCWEWQGSKGRGGR